jgi:hypothetical protein
MGACGKPAVGILQWTKTDEFVTCKECRAIRGLSSPDERLAKKDAPAEFTEEALVVVQAGIKRVHSRDFR